MLIFLTGGARSGKSGAAVSAAARSGLPVVFIATATPGDGEMAQRIALHQAERPSSWTTVEAPLEVGLAVDAADESACVVVDCLSLWVSNLMLAQPGPPVFDTLVSDVLHVCACRPGPTIVVSNEVGSGIVPNNELARRFRDELGRVNRRFADRADRAYLTVAGRLVALNMPLESLLV